jgi:transposase
MEPVMSSQATGVKKYTVRLSAEERQYLTDITRKGRGSAGRLTKALILLRADEGWSDACIVEAVGTSLSTVLRVRRQLVEEGLEAAISRKKRETPPVAPIFDGEKEARLIHLACSEPPPGRTRWTLCLLEEKVVELGIVEKASDNTIGRVLKKTNLSLI